VDRFDFQTYLPQQFDGQPFCIDDLLQLEDDAEVDRFVVMPEITDRPDNAGIADRIEGCARAVLCAAVNPAPGQEAVSDFRRSVDELGAKGLKLSPIVHGFGITDPAVEPLLTQAQSCGIPVTTESCDEGCHPAQITEVAERFPELTLIADVGFRPLAPPASLNQPPPPEGRIADVAASCPNVYLGLPAMATAETYLIKRILDAVGVEKLVFGSGAPWGVPAFSVGGVKQARLGAEAESMFLGGTLARLYG
jgi:predicted TIM-barrel fold metal-dependent hydrolase